MAEKAPRHRNPRVEVVARLRRIKRHTANLIGAWNVAGYVFLAADERPESGEWKRQREPHEYPENDVEEWERLARNAEALVTHFEALAVIARDRATQLRQEQS